MNTFFTKYELGYTAKLLGSDFRDFETAGGMTGLARVTKGNLDILAVIATKPGNGQFRKFIQDAKETFNTVAVWQVWSTIAIEALKRYGFAPILVNEHGEEQTVWTWYSDKSKQALFGPIMPVVELLPNLHTTIPKVIGLGKEDFRLPIEDMRLPVDKEVESPYIPDQFDKWMEEKQQPYKIL